jgi:hypothetical protein
MGEVRRGVEGRLSAEVGGADEGRAGGNQADGSQQEGGRADAQPS